MAIGAPLSVLTAIQAANIWDRLFLSLRIFILYLHPCMPSNINIILKNSFYCSKRAVVSLNGSRDIETIVRYYVDV